jgi:hypothetical protein
MKLSPLWIVVIIALLAACQQPPATGRTGSPLNLPPTIDTSAWPTYENAGYGFALRHPEGWEIREASDPEAAFGIIAWGYSPSQAKALRDCENDTSKDERNLTCGRFHADSSFGLYDSEYADYAALDDALKTNYPNYRPLVWKDLRGFEYDGRTDPPSHVYLLTKPDGKDALEVIAWTQEANAQATVRALASTASFTGK